MLTVSSGPSRGHVMRSRFEAGTSSQGRARAGVVQGASGCVFGFLGVIPPVGG
jgi:hypothetical protein